MPQDENKKTLQEIHEMHEVEEAVPRKWPVILAYLWAAFLVALVVVFGGRWVYDSVKDDVNKSSGQVASGSSDDKAKGAVIVPAKPGSGKIAQPKKPSPPASTSTNPSNIPNTGDATDLPEVLPSTGG